MPEAFTSSVSLLVVGEYVPVACPPRMGFGCSLRQCANGEARTGTCVRLSLSSSPVGLRRAAPAAIQQNACRRDARGRGTFSWLTMPASTLGAELGVPPAPATANRQVFSFGAGVYEVGLPPPAGACYRQRNPRIDGGISEAEDRADGGSRLDYLTM